jgi:hypothetical protein
MGDFLILWLRGFVFAVAFVMFLAFVSGLIYLVLEQSHIGIPLFMFLILPVLFGILTEGKV